MIAQERRDIYGKAAKRLFPKLHLHYSIWPEQALDRVLGVTEFKTYRRTASTDDKPMDPELKRFVLQLLHSPHARTLIKVWRIQKGLHKCTGSAQVRK